VSSFWGSLGAVGTNTRFLCLASRASGGCGYKHVVFVSNMTLAKSVCHACVQTYINQDCFEQ